MLIILTCKRLRSPLRAKIISHGISVSCRGPESFDGSAPVVSHLYESWINWPEVTVSLAVILPALKSYKVSARPWLGRKALEKAQEVAVMH